MADKDWYGSSLASSGDGSAGDPWTLAQANTAWGDGTVADTDRVNLKADGTYTTGDTVWTGNGSAGKKVLRGYTDVIGDGGKATIQRSSGAGILMSFTSQQVTIRDLIIDGQDGGTHNLQVVAHSFVINVESHSAGGRGLNAANVYAVFLNCYAHDNVSWGIGATTQAVVYNCTAYNNDGTGIVAAAGGVFYCIAKDNGGYNIQVTNGNVVNCISDNSVLDGIRITQHQAILNCILINSPVGTNAFSSNIGLAVNCNFWNNDSDMPDLTRKLNCQALDPQFNDPDSLDYRRTGDNLNRLGASEIGLITGVDYEVSIGPDGIVEDLPVVGVVQNNSQYDFGRLTGTLLTQNLSVPIALSVSAESIAVALEVS